MSTIMVKKVNDGWAVFEEDNGATKWLATAGEYDDAVDLAKRTRKRREADGAFTVLKVVDYKALEDMNLALAEVMEHDVRKDGTLGLSLCEKYRSDYSNGDVDCTGCPVAKLYGDGCPALPVGIMATHSYERLTHSYDPVPEKVAGSILQSYRALLVTVFRSLAKDLEELRR